MSFTDAKEARLRLLLRRERDDKIRERCRASLHEFVREFWYVVEPGRQFVDNWHLQWLCAELEAISDGEQTRLLANVPPGAMKSLLLVFWTAWEWGPRDMRHLRYLSAAYTQTLTIRDNRRRKAILMSEKYQRLWPAVRIDPNRTSDENFGNTATGWCIATSTGGVGTGERADRVICLPHSQKVLTEIGPVAVGDLVATRAALLVPNLNERTGSIEMKRIIGWHRNPANQILRLTFASGLSICCTPTHRLRKALGDWKAAAAIPVGAGLRTFDIREISRGIAPVVPALDRGDSSPRQTVAAHQFPDWLGRDEDGSGDFACGLGLGMTVACPPIASVREGAVALSVGDVLGAGAVGQIVKPGVGPVAVTVSHLAAGRRRSDECEHDELMAEPEGDLAGIGQADARVSLAQGRFENPLFDRFGGGVEAAAHDDTGHAFDAPKVGHLVTQEARDGEPLLDRLVGVVHESCVPETYCLTIADNHNMFLGDGQVFIPAMNCDDPHSVNTAESDAIRAQTLHWWREVVPTRINDPVLSAFVVIMQRVHADDVSGDILDNRGPEWTHLMIPMSYEPDRHCVTDHGEDPRTKAGELYWPERFPEWTVKRDSVPLGKYGVAAQFQQLPSPRGGGIIEDQWWKVWPPPDEADRWTQVVTDENGKERAIVGFPPADFMMAYVDTAFTAKEENAYCAFIRFSVFSDSAGRPRVMMNQAWQDKPTLRDLCTRILGDCRRGRVDVLVIENKAGAEWVKQEMQLLMRAGEFSIVLDDPRGDKTARLTAISPLLQDGVVYAPDRAWADQVIRQCSEFPRGKFKDLVDCTSGGLGYLRRNDLIKLSNEFDEDERDRKTWRGRSEGVAGLYEVG